MNTNDIHFTTPSIHYGWNEMYTLVKDVSSHLKLT